MLQIERLTVRFREVEALSAISVSADQGAITVVLGPNASGKSTLLRCAAGLHQPTSGRITLSGEDVWRLAPRRRAARMAYVPQRSTVSAAFTVRQVIELGRYALSPQRSRIDEAIETMDLGAVAHRPYAALSVGQQQRVSLARALAQLGEEGLLILDEPTSAMDLRHIRIVRDAVVRVARRGCGVLMAVHDLTLGGELADQAVLLRDGRLNACGDAEAILQPQRLAAVFDVPFVWVEIPGGSRRLIATEDPSDAEDGYTE